VTLASPITGDELLHVREQLPATSSIAYLNTGSFGPLPKVTLAAMLEQDTYDAEFRQDTDHWDRLSSLQQRARQALTLLTGVAPEQVALMHTTHEGLNACLWGMDLRSGDNVVTTNEEHPGLLVPLRHMRHRVGVDVRAVQWQDDDDAFVDRVLSKVDERTRAVALSHVSWLSGRTAPLRKLRDGLRDDVRLIVDGAQSGAVFEIDLADGWDAYTISGQKWPCGPSGSGGLALRDPEAWLPTYGAYTQVTDYDDFLGSPLTVEGRRLEMSQEALAPLAGFAASVGWIVGEVGLPRVLAHARACNVRARELLAGSGVDPASIHGTDHLLAIDVPRADELATALYGDGYLIRSLSTERLRISFGFWNTADEVEGCIAALCARMLTD
jgi:L-cysteine/cystine lyase